jgi:hypothetical protein
MDIVERLRGYARGGGSDAQEAADEIERLRQCGGNCRYWEGRWRDEYAENERLRRALKAIENYPHAAPALVRAYASIALGEGSR